MLSWTALFLVCCALAALCFIYNVATERKWRNRSPPRPWGIPILGHLHYQVVEPLLHKTFFNLAEKYGPMFRFDMFGYNCVVINDPNWLREVFQKDSFSGRPDHSSFDFSSNDGTCHGMLFTQGDVWKAIRSFCVKEFRQFHLRPSTEASILKEVETLATYLKGLNGKSVGDWKNIFFTTALNPIWEFLVGKGFTEDNDPERHDVFQRARDAVKNLLGGKGGVLFLFPGLCRKFPYLSGLNQLKTLKSIFATYFLQLVKHHQSEILNKGKKEGQFCQAFLNEGLIQGPGSPFAGELGEKHLVGVLGDFYTAATESYSSTLPWMVLYLSKSPEVQAKMVAEITKITRGGSRHVTLKDRKSMPYTEAVIHETLRLSSVAPLGDFHLATSDQCYREYFIPKGTLLLGNIYYIHHSKALWGDPDNFRPERFLSKDSGGNLIFSCSENFIPFSVGRRQCPGYQLAMDTFFLFSTNLLKRFQFYFDSSQPDYGYKADAGLNLSPKPFRVFVKCTE